MQRWMVRRLPIRQKSAVMGMVESRLPGVPAPLRVQIRFSSDPELITFIRRRVGGERWRERCSSDQPYWNQFGGPCKPMRESRA
jgi:hypothetical protein